jgi:tRNA nucleotidyltransferase (CCA-adding enzyme)
MKKIYHNSIIGHQAIPAFVMGIIRRLNGAGFNAYPVGGAVRNSLLNRPVADWDIVTSAPNDEITRIFKDVRHFSLKHETVTLVHEKSHYEVTSMRGAEKDWTIEKDLGHRDFTINAMAWDLAKEDVIDPHGGKKDLHDRIIRATGEPSERFTEDPLRLIRAVRISAELGFKIEDNTWKAIVKVAPDLILAAPERIREEFMKILLLRRPSTGFRLLARSGLLTAFLPELMEGLLKRQNHWHRYTVFRHIMETVDHVAPDPVLRLAALFHDIAKPRVRTKDRGEFRFHGHAEASALLAREIMERLRFSNEMTREATSLISHHMVEYDGTWSDGAIRRLIRRFAPDPVERLLKFRRADLLAHGVADKELELLSELEQRVRAISVDQQAGHVRDLALNGQKIMDILGISPGPEVGTAQHFLMEIVMDHPELNTEEALTNLLKKTNKKGSSPN